MFCRTTYALYPVPTASASGSKISLSTAKAPAPPPQQHRITQNEEMKFKIFGNERATACEFLASTNTLVPIPIAQPLRAAENYFELDEPGRRWNPIMGVQANKVNFEEARPVGMRAVLNTVRVNTEGTATPVKMEGLRRCGVGTSMQGEVSHGRVMLNSVGTRVWGEFTDALGAGNSTGVKRGAQMMFNAGGMPGFSILGQQCEQSNNDWRRVQGYSL